MEADTKNEGGGQTRERRHGGARRRHALFVAAGATLGVSLWGALEARGAPPAVPSSPVASAGIARRRAAAANLLDLARRAGSTEMVNLAKQQQKAASEGLASAKQALDALQAKAAAARSSADAAARIAGAQKPAADAQKPAADAQKPAADAQKQADAAKAEADAAQKAYDSMAARAGGADVKSLSECPSAASNAGHGLTDPRTAGNQSICASCGGPGTVCLEAATGLALCEKPLPRSVAAGQTLNIDVYGVDGTDLPANVSVVVTYLSTNDGLTNADAADTGAAPPDGGSSADGGTTPPADSAEQLSALLVQCSALAPPVKYSLVLPKSIQVSTDSRVQSLTITTSNTRPGTSSGSVQITVDHGKYYVEAGFLIPFIPGGSRTVVASPLPGGGGQKTITVADDWRVTPAIVLNVFPWGRRRALYSPFQVLDRCRTWGDLLGLQGGIGLNFTQAPSFMFGVVVEPVTGLSFNGGVALLQGQFVPANYAVNMLLPQGETLAFDTRYMARGYFGITATTDIVTLLTTAFSAPPTL